MLRSADGVVVDAAALSDPGRDPEKQTNEDALSIAEVAGGVAAVVCDGMGGHDAGEVASRTAVQRILETLQAPAPAIERHLSRALELAHADVYALGGDAPLEVRPGSTAVVVLIIGMEAWVAHVGDSRAYRVRGRTVERLTRDHSVVEALLAARAISEEAAKNHPDANRITRALGIAAEIEPEIQAPLRAEVGDSFVLCSDGLSDLVEDAELGSIVGTSPAPEAACQTLVELANSRGGHDNISVVVLRVLGLGTRQYSLEKTDPGTLLEGTHQTQTMAAARTALHPTPTSHDDGRSTTPTLIDPLVAERRKAQAGPTKLDPLPAGAGLPRPSAPPQRPINWWFWGGVCVCGVILLAIVLWSALR